MAAKGPRKSAAPASWAKFKKLPGLVLAFHGCERKTGLDLLHGRIGHLKHSENDYDWLGRGIYFWESDPWRALDWAEESCRRRAAATGKPFNPRGKFLADELLQEGLKRKAVPDLLVSGRLVDQGNDPDVREATHQNLRLLRDAQLWPVQGACFSRLEPDIANLREDRGLDAKGDTSTLVMSVLVRLGRQHQ